MYQNYIFDFYGTLADIRTDEEDFRLWRKMGEIYGALGAPYGARELRHAFRRLEEDERKRLGGENAEPDLTKVFALLYHEKEAFCDDDRARMTAIVFRALSRRFLRAYDGVEELLKELRQRGKRIYLLSNAQTDFTRPEIEMLGLTRFFDDIVISSEQGCKKPSPEFFRRLLQKHSLKPAECIMIGNDAGTDIAGARSVGMDTLYIHTAISPGESEGVKATYCVSDGDFRKAAEILLERDGTVVK